MTHDKLILKFIWKHKWSNIIKTFILKDEKQSEMTYSINFKLIKIIWQDNTGGMEHDFWISALLTFGAGWFFAVGGSSVHYKMLSSKPGPYSLDASSTFSQVWQPKMSPHIIPCRITPSWKLRVQKGNLKQIHTCLETWFMTEQTWHINEREPTVQQRTLIQVVSIWDQWGCTPVANISSKDVLQHYLPPTCASAVWSCHFPNKRQSLVRVSRL